MLSSCHIKRLANMLNVFHWYCLYHCLQHMQSFGMQHQSISRISMKCWQWYYSIKFKQYTKDWIPIVPPFKFTRQYLFYRFNSFFTFAKLILRHWSNTATPPSNHPTMNVFSLQIRSHWNYKWHGDGIIGHSQ